MAYLIEAPNCPVVYCENYRVGSTATADTLVSMGAVQIGTHHAPIEDLPIGAIVVQTVRNHFDVIVSFYYKEGAHIPFESYVDCVLDGQHCFLQPDAFYNRFGKWDYILSYNTLQFEFDTLCFVTGLPCTKIDIQPTNYKYKNLFTPTLQDKVAERYSEELKRIGYGIS